MGPDEPLVIIHDLFTDRETYPRTRKFPAVQPLEHFEYFLAVFRLETEAIVFDSDPF